MKFYLLKMKVNGIKNIDKDIELFFYNKTLTKQFNPDRYNVKAIYGANGAGKTALIYAAEIYKKFVINRDYLSLYNSNLSLANLINQNTKKFAIEMTFAVLSDDYNIEHVFSHMFALKNVNGLYFIDYEELKELKGFRLNSPDKWVSVYKTSNGDLINNKDNLLGDISKNVLFDRSLPSIVMTYQSINGFNNNKIFEKISYVYDFAQNLTVLLYLTDKNYIDSDYVNNQLYALSKYKREMNQTTFTQLFLNQSLIYNDEIPIKKTDYEEYKKGIDNFTKFMQIFKPDLKEVVIKKEENIDFYICSISFLYKDGRLIARKYESTGIKKLMSLYYALCNVEKGGIVFIDEFDANIHDVILLKLVDYIRQYTKGQLIFTTHNLGPMEVLQEDKCSIDFLSNDSRVTSWKKIGNCSASNVYRKGLIQYSPFNIEAFSFLGVFGDDANQ